MNKQKHPLEAQIVCIDHRYMKTKNNLFFLAKKNFNTLSRSMLNVIALKTEIYFINLGLFISYYIT